MILRSIRACPKCVSISHYLHPGVLTTVLCPKVNRRTNSLRFSTKRWDAFKTEDNGSRVVNSQPNSALNDDVRGAKRKKTMAELDEELRAKLEGLSGDGGSAGVEHENGRAEGLKRGVKANMFRVI